MYAHIYRSAVTGRIVPEWYALRYPHFTVRETVYRPESNGFKALINAVAKQKTR